MNNKETVLFVWKSLFSKCKQLNNFLNITRVGKKYLKEGKTVSSNFLWRCTSTKSIAIHHDALNHNPSNSFDWWPFGKQQHSRKRPGGKQNPGVTSLRFRMTSFFRLFELINANGMELLWRRWSKFFSFVDVFPSSACFIQVYPNVITR